MSDPIRSQETDDAFACAGNWFAGQLKPNGLRIAKANLQRQGFPCFAPVRRERFQSARGPQMRLKPLFPGYIFVSVEPRSPRWRALNNTRGLTRMIVTDISRPRPLPDMFIQALMARCEEMRDSAPDDQNDYAVGDLVRILQGPFADVVSRVERMSADQRLELLLDLMGQKVRVSVDTRDTIKAG